MVDVSMRYSLGCVPFLNAKPLIHYFSTPSADLLPVEVSFAVPTDLAEWVANGSVQAALASSYFALAQPGAVVAAGVSISSFGPVESVRLFSKRPFSEIRSLALDSGSMTSNHLSKIILAERYGVYPVATTAKPNLDDMLAAADAAVLIGDAGMTAAADGLFVMDLGAAWHEMTGLPFVWALWIGTDGLTDDLAALLSDAKRYGVRNLEDIAQSESKRLGIPYHRCLRYLAEIIDCDLTPAHIEGFSRFARLCLAHGLLEQVRMPKFVGSTLAGRRETT